MSSTVIWGKQPTNKQQSKNYKTRGESGSSEYQTFVNYSDGHFPRHDLITRQKDRYSDAIQLAVKVDFGQFAI